LVGGAEAFVGKRGRQPDVDDRDVRMRCTDSAEEAADVTFGGADVHSRLGKQSYQALAQQDLGIYDRYSYARTAISRWRP
jgi:hypothetical protein